MIEPVLWSEDDSEAAYQRRLYRFYIRRLENLTEAKITKELKSAQHFLVKEKIHT